jgi:hypothetical protein
VSLTILAGLAGLATAQESLPQSQQNAPSTALAPIPAKTPYNGYAGSKAGACQGTGCVSSPRDLALQPESWPPLCSETVGCDPCDRVLTGCPAPCDYFLVPPRPRFYIEADGAAIRRDPGRVFSAASLGMIPAGTLDPSNIVLSTRNLEYDFRAAGRVLIGCTVTEFIQIEGVYSAVSESENTAAIRDDTPNGFDSLTGNLFSPFGNFGASPVANLDYNNFAQIHYTSSMQSAELNLRRKVPMPPVPLSTSILFGLRYMTVPERFTYATTSNVAFTPDPAAGSVSNTIYITTENQLIGPQIGALFEFFVDNRWWVNVEIKGAVMNNRSEQSTTYTSVINGASTTTFGSEREDHTAWAGDLALTFLYRWSPHFTTRVGYQALWLYDLALASDNLNTDIDIIRQGPAQLNHTSSTVYHGPFAGITLGW